MLVRPHGSSGVPGVEHVQDAEDEATCNRATPPHAFRASKIAPRLHAFFKQYCNLSPNTTRILSRTPCWLIDRDW